MCHASVFDFFRAEISPVDIEGQRILEVGSRDVNGSVRSFLMSLGARDYVGVDREPGPGVDRVCDVAGLASEFAHDPFDVVVTTEMLEHVRDWRSAVSNLKQVVAPKGLLVITTRSFGYPFHDFPGDYWRYELDDMRTLFRDFSILKLIPDPQCPGVFLKCQKPLDFSEIDTSQCKLFSVVKAERSSADEIADEEILTYEKRMRPLTGIGREASRILLSVDLADIGQRDFRNLWRSLERLSVQLQTLRRRSDLPGAPSPSRRIERLRRRLLELLTATRLARGRSFLRARRELLRSAGGSQATDVLLTRWALIEEEPFQEILGSLESIRSLCVKVQSYARPSTLGPRDAALGEGARLR